VDLYDIEIENTDFNIMELDSADEKVAFVWQVLQKCPLMQEHQIPFEEFSNFITLVRHEYNKRENPFHNFVHGATVMHGCYTLSQTEKAINHLNIVQRFAMVFAGLVHDVDHTGKTNLYEINMRSKLATLHNDRSVLEHHHLAQTYYILQCPGADIFCNFDTGLRNDIRRYMINNILATDNKYHFQFLNKFEIKLKTDDPTQFGTYVYLAL
jgi:cAMP-specific phosphodiesterase 4